MTLKSLRNVGAFTIGEMMVSVAVTSLLFGALFMASLALTRAYAASDDYFSTHLQQIRIIDYLSRDVKRSFSVTVTSSPQTVTCIIPNYIIQSGDPEAVANSATIGQRRTPVVVGPPYKAIVDYGTNQTRTVLDGVTTNNSYTLTSATANFSASDVGNPVSANTISAGATISSVQSTTSVTLSLRATATATARTLTIYGDGNRTVMDAATTNGSTNLTSATAYFTAADVGRYVAGTSIVAGAQISSITSTTVAVMSIAASQTVTNSSVSIGGSIVVYAVSGNTITRTENGVLTTIASSTDSLLPTTIDYTLANTEYTSTSVTFLPVFQLGEGSAQRTGTTVYSTAYLRNKRRGN